MKINANDSFMKCSQVNMEVQVSYINVKLQVAAVNSKARYFYAFNMVLHIKGPVMALDAPDYG